MASRARLLLLPAAVVIAAPAACTTSTLSSPRILAVESPDPYAYIGEDRVLSITGEGFSGGITADAENTGDSEEHSARVFIHLEGAVDAIFVTGTFLGPTRFEGTIDENPTPDLIPGRYAVGVINDDGSRDVFSNAFEMGYRGVRLALVTTTSTELAPGDSNRLTVEMQLLGATGDPGFRKEPTFSLTPFVVDGDATISTSQSLEVVPGEYLDAVFAVHDSSVEAVTLSAAGVPSDIIVEPLVVGFIPGTPFQARLLPAVEINSLDNFADTLFQIEDRWENVATTHAEYSADFAFSICPGASSEPPNPLIIPANAGTLPVRILCGSVNDTLVNFSENSSTGYGGSGVSTFFDFN